MSILIRGMEMPQKCGQCKFYHAEYPMYCMAVKGYRTVGAPYGMPRPDWCPLIEISQQARLIDANAHIREIRKQYCEDCSRRKGIKNGKMQFCYEIGGVVCRACEIEDMLNALDDAQAVIEAEGEKDGR